MAKVSLKLRTNHKLKSGKHSVILKVSHKQQRWQHNLGGEYTRSEFDKAKFSDTDKAIYENAKGKAETIVAKARLENILFPKEELEKAFNGTTEISFSSNLEEFVNQLRTEMIKKDKLGNASTYRDSLKAFKNFKNTKTRLDSITPSLLSQFESYLIQRDLTHNTISVYLRTLRAIINKALTKGLIQDYPFKNKTNPNGFDMSKYQTTQNPRAIDKKDIISIEQYCKEKKEHWEHGLMFLFSYYCYGINFTDMARLKKSDVSNYRFTYKRRKTKNNKPIPVSIPDQAKSIFDHFKTKDYEYLFPVLNSFHKTESQKFNRIKSERRKFNKALKAIGNECNIESELTSYTARHTFANRLRQQGVSAEKIGQAMGHSKLATTEIYLSHFPESEMEEIGKKL